MDNVINEKNFDEYRESIDSNFSDGIKVMLLNYIECNYYYLFESNKLTENKLDELTRNITDNEEFNDYLDSYISDKIIDFIRENELDEEEKI